MNREVLESQWPQIREILGEKFSNLTEEDIRQINGRYDQLVAKLQQKYGYTREEAEDRIRSWNFDRFARPTRGSTLREDSTMREDRISRDDRVARDDNSSLFKWLLALGIPLLLLGAYFLTPDRTDTPVTNQERVVTETPADRSTSMGIRNALVNQNLRSSDLQNVRITTQNGVVTLDGSVPSTAVSNSIENTAENFSGVRDVINNLQVR